MSEFIYVARFHDEDYTWEARIFIAAEDVEAAACCGDTLAERYARILKIRLGASHACEIDASKVAFPHIKAARYSTDGSPYDKRQLKLPWPEPGQYITDPQLEKLFEFVESREK